MSLECGQAIEVQDLYGAISAQFIAQCHGRWLAVRHDGQPGNGMLHQDWRFVLRELVAMTVPTRLITHQRTVRSLGDGHFQQFPLTYPLPVSSLAALLNEDADAVQAALTDLAVQYES